MTKIGFLSFLAGLIFAMNSLAQLPTAKEVASHMTIGWNLGNTLEAVGGETAWGNPLTTQRLIDSIKAKGFNTVRIPVAWYGHCNQSTNVINAAWLARVKTVVDYCMKDSLYTFINVHWDGGWLENHVTVADSASVNARQRAFWTQIATFFKDYDEHLLFASANEPNVSDATGMTVLMSYHQTFINTVRATGGNNASRTLVIQGPSTDIDATNRLMGKMPKDVIQNRLIAEVHYYTPWNFCGLTEDASWGKMFYYWGKGYHSTANPTRNATWGEENEMANYFQLMKTKFVDKGIPVIIGEYGAVTRAGIPDIALHVSSRQYWYKTVVKYALQHGLIPYVWDTGGVINRNNGDVIDKGVLSAIMQGAAEVLSTAVAPEMKTTAIKLYPNPFTSTFILQLDNPREVNSIDIFDVMGKKVATINASEISAQMSIGAHLNPGTYIVRVNGQNWTKSYKTLKTN